MLEVHANTVLLVSTNMPMMPRPMGKATRIAYAILGKPAAMRKKRGRKSNVQRRLQSEDTRLIKGVNGGS